MLVPDKAALSIAGLRELYTAISGVYMARLGVTPAS